MKNSTFILLFSFILIFVFNSCKRSSKTIGNGGAITGGVTYITKCTKPSKRYTKSIEAVVNATIKTLDTTKSSRLNAVLKREVVKLADYSQKGLDLDLILFRLCELSRNSSLTQENSNSLFSQAITTWNNSLSIKEQKNIISQLSVELSANLKTANELKLNTETILNNLIVISGKDIIRNPKIQILSLIFPIENLQKTNLKSVQNLVDSSLNSYLEAKLDTNKLEKTKFSEVGRRISLTLEKTMPTLISLSDVQGTRYPIYNTIWNTNSQNLSKIDVFDITKFQETYSELNSLKTNYNIVNSRAIDYLKDLNTFFDSKETVITRAKLEKVLTSERFAFDLIATYTNSLAKNIENLINLQKTVNNSIN